MGAVELTERFEVMDELEAMCARLATSRATADDIARIKAAQTVCAEAAETGDHDTYYHQNTAFHQAIYAASGNRFLEEEARRLQTMLQPYRRQQLQLRGRMMRSLDEHHHIMNAIERGAADEASVLMNAHVVIQGDRFHQLIASLRQ